MVVSALGVFPEIEGLELELLVVPPLEPDYHGVVVALSDVVLVGPLVLLGLVDRLGLAALEGVRVVAEFEAMVVVLAELLDAEQAGVGKGLNVDLIRLFIHELMIVLSHLVVIKIDHGYLILPCLEHHNLLVVHHAERVDIVLQQAFV